MFLIKVINEKKMTQYFQILFQLLLFKALLIINFLQGFKFQDSLLIFTKHKSNKIQINLLNRKKRRKKVKQKTPKTKKKEIFLNNRMKTFCQKMYNPTKVIHLERKSNNFFLCLNWIMKKHYNMSPDLNKLYMKDKLPNLNYIMKDNWVMNQ